MGQWPKSACTHIEVWTAGVQLSTCRGAPRQPRLSLPPMSATEAGRPGRVDRPD
jgi:hypothetical protein